MFSRIFGGELIPLDDNRKRIKIANKTDMLKAFHGAIEEYLPVLGEDALACESGVSEISYQNLNILMEKFGKPQKVDVNKGEVVLVHWVQGLYLATGFAVGYYGLGPYKFALFGEEAGFGEFENLYEQINLLDRNYTGILW